MTVLPVILQITLGLTLGAALGFALAWLIRGKTVARSASYIRSLEQLLAGTTRERDAAMERERLRVSGTLAAQQEQAQRLVELEKELSHRELQVVTLRDEAIQLARTREELGQRLARRERTVQELEATLAARMQELQELAAQRGGHRPSGSGITGPERELAALVAAHEDDLAQLEARYLEEARGREAELGALRQRLQTLEAAVGERSQRDAQLAAARERIAELEALGRRTAELEGELSDGKAAHAKLQERLADLEPMTARLRELEERLAQLDRSETTASADARPGGSTSGEEAARRPPVLASNGRPEREPGAGAPRSRSRRSRNTGVDDLTLIAGIDASVEQALHLLGITTFRQLARWKDKDIERLASKLYQPADRIREEGWVQSARQEYTRKYGRAP
jgi:predicted flap endonuclease-1-like 5' DNA nuclease